MEALHSIDSSRPYERVLESPKTETSSELFLPENDFKTCYTVNFLKNIQVLKAWKPSENMKLRL